MIDVVILGEINIDLVLEGVKLPEVGKEHLANEMCFTMGSSSAITAHNLSALGSKVGFCGRVGNDIFGDFMIQKLQERGIDTSPIKISSSSKTGATVVFANQGKKALATYTGAMSEFSSTDLNWDYIAKANHMHMGSFFLQTGICHEVGRIFAKAKSLGLTTSLDTNWDPDENWNSNLHEALAHTDIFFPNEDEAKCIAGTDDLESAINYLRKKVQILAVKRAEHGSAIYHKDNSWQIPCIPIKRYESTGAGDSFNAGFIHKYLQESSLPDCLRFANTCGALAVTEAGGTTAFQNAKHVADFLKINLRQSPAPHHLQQPQL